MTRTKDYTMRFITDAVEIPNHPWLGQSDSYTGIYPAVDASAEHPTAHQTIRYTNTDDGLVVVGADMGGRTVGIAIGDELVMMTPPEARNLALDLEIAASEAEPWVMDRKAPVRVALRPDDGWIE